MRSIFLAAPFALLCAACASRVTTPAGALFRFDEAAPPASLVVLPAAEDAIERWALPPDDPWARYEKLTLLTALGEEAESAHMPDVAALPSVVRARWAAYQLALAGVPDDTLFLVDLRGAASVAFGATLSQHAGRPVSLVSTFNNWPSDDGLVPAEETLAAMTTFDPRQPAPGEKGVPVFLLDAWRLAYRDSVIEDGVTDNRYVLGAADLPDADALRARGITRVVYVVEDHGEVGTEEDDVHDLMASYEAAGIGTFLVDFAWCEGRADHRAWGPALVGVELHVVPRPLVIHDPYFYARSPGGFGGVHAIPGGWHGPPPSSGGHGGGGRTYGGAHPHVGGFGG